MATVKMTTLWLSRLKPGEEADYTDADSRGLQLRVRKTGMTWCFQYKLPGTSFVRRMTIGPYPGIGLAEARKAALDLRARVAKGEDPAGKAKAEKQTPLFADLCREYLEKHAVHKRSRREDERIVVRELIPRWGSLRADKITRRMVIALLDEIVARGSPIMANRTLALVRKVFNWALSRDILENTPCLRIKPPAPEKSRDRWLTDEEIRAVWEAFGAEPTAGPILKILLLTGQRRGEVTSMLWSEVDLEASIWTIPPEKSKNKLRHTVPLSTPVLEILGALPRKNEFVFPSPRRLCGHVNNLGKTLDRIEALSGVKFHIHDLRRTCATGMARLGVSREVIAKVLNHVDRSVTGVYERHGYEAEKRRALEKWADHVLRLVNSRTAAVITLPTRA